MTYQTSNPNYDTTDADADEASLLVCTAVDASPGLSFGHDEGLATKKKHGVPRVAVVVATCLFLATLVVLYPGSRIRSSNNRAPDATTLWNQAVHGIRCCPQSDDYCNMKYYTLFLGRGCIRSSCFACADGSNCCLKNAGYDYSCPNCCSACENGSMCCFSNKGRFDSSCPNCGTSF